MSSNERQSIPPLTMSLVDAARAISVSPRTLTRLAAEGLVRIVQIGRRRLIETEELRRFVEKSRQ